MELTRRLAAVPTLVAKKAAWLVLVGMPRRQLNIPKWTRGREFRDLHSASVAWLDSHFEVIERGAPWLHRIGTDVWDFCTGGVQPFFRLEGGNSAGAHCVREVTSVYGLSGELLPLLRSLDQALPPAGWTMGTQAVPQSWADLDPGRAAALHGMASHHTSWMRDRYAILSWAPTRALGYPSRSAGTPPWGRPPLTPRMRVRWSSRGQDTGWRGNPSKHWPTTRGYVAVESSQADVVRLLEEALSRYEHAVTATINLTYYSNHDALARNHRLPRCLLPTPPGGWRARSR